jgi:hypothetical protein
MIYQFSHFEFRGALLSREFMQTLAAISQRVKR